MNALRFAYEKVFRKSLTYCILLAFFSNFVVEVLSRRSLFATFSFIGNKPMVFLYNTMLMLIPYLVALLVRRRVFIYVLVTAVYVIAGAVNFYMLSYRTTPFTGVDLTLIESGLDVLNNYMSVLQIILIVIAVLLVIALVVFCWFKSPKKRGKRHLLGSTLFIVLYLLVFSQVTEKAIEAGVLSKKFGNLKISYQDYGFAYCFGVTVIDSGIDMPKGYNESMMQRILDPSNSANIDNEEYSTPNLIMIQLESFFDPTEMIGLELSEDPVPNWHRLQEQFTTGHVTVPTVVAGTCNTEFEMITGMNLGFFGPGEYPYKTVLKETVSESIPFDLMELGYSTHAIHNNKATFYGRNNVFANLGFQTFTSVEYMYDYEFTENGWVKDGVLTECIMDTLTQTEGPDFTYTISVQPHGAYPTEPYPEETPIKVVSGLATPEEIAAMEYYVKQLREMDQFVADLIAELEQFDEDVVLIMYGDHIPGLGLSNEILTYGDIYQTPYIIWDNTGRKKVDGDRIAYQMASLVLGEYGINQGTMIKFHQNYKDTNNYQENMERLQYDMLYGERYIYGGKTPFVRTDLRYGINKITLTGVDYDGSTLTVYGENLNEFGQLSVNGEEYVKGTFTEEKTLVFTEITLEDSDIIVIGQIRGDSILSETSPMVYHADTMELTALEAFGDDGKVGNTVNSIDIKAYVEEMATSASVQTESQEEADGTGIMP